MYIPRNPQGIAAAPGDIAAALAAMSLGIILAGCSITGSISNPVPNKGPLSLSISIGEPVPAALDE